MKKISYWYRLTPRGRRFVCGFYKDYKSLPTVIPAEYIR